MRNTVETQEPRAHIVFYEMSIGGEIPAKGLEEWIYEPDVEANPDWDGQCGSILNTKNWRAMDVDRARWGKLLEEAKTYPG